MSARRLPDLTVAVQGPSDRLIWATRAVMLSESEAGAASKELYQMAQAVQFALRAREPKMALDYLNRLDLIVRYSTGPRGDGVRAKISDLRKAILRDVGPAEDA